MRNNIISSYLNDLKHYFDFQELELFTLTYLFLKYLQKYARKENSEREFIQFISSKKIIEIIDNVELEVNDTYYYYSKIMYTNNKYNCESLLKYLGCLDENNISDVLIYISKFIQTDEIKITSSYVDFLTWFINNHLTSDNLSVLEYMGSNTEIMYGLFNALKISKYTCVTSSRIEFYIREVLSITSNYKNVDNYNFYLSCNNNFLIQEKFDLVYSLFPWDLKFDNNQLEINLASIQYTTNDFKFINYIHSKLKLNSFGFVFVHENILLGKKFNADREKLIKTNTIMTIIRLPKKSLENISGFTYLLILSNEVTTFELFDFSEFYKIINNKTVISVDKFIDNYSKKNQRYYRKFEYKDFELVNFNINFENIFS